MLFTQLENTHTRKDILEHENGNHYNVGHDQILNNLKNVTRIKQFNSGVSYIQKEIINKSKST